MEQVLNPRQVPHQIGFKVVRQRGSVMAQDLNRTTTTATKHRPTPKPREHTPDLNFWL
jgi:hypothetical protein